MLPGFSAQFQQRQAIPLRLVSKEGLRLSSLRRLLTFHRLDLMIQVWLRPLTCTDIWSNESSHMLINDKEDKKKRMPGRFDGVLSPEYTPRQSVEKSAPEKGGKKKSGIL